MRKDPVTPQQVYRVTSPSGFPQRDQQNYTGNCKHEKRKTQTFGRSLNIGSDLTLIPGDPKDNHGPLIREELRGK